MSDLHELVPRERKANLRYRLKVRKRAEKDEAYRKAVLAACKQDVLYWLKAFCWVFEPRVEEGVRDEPEVLPFIPWSHQTPFIKELQKHLGYRDIGLIKSRGEGASWMFVLFAVYDFIFMPRSSVAIVSRDELAAFNPDDPDSIGWKISFELSQMPPWMIDESDIDHSETRRTWRNKRNEAIMSAFACSNDVGSGGRRKWFLMDELSKFPVGKDSKAVTATQAVTNCRAFVATPNGMENEYYRLMADPESDLVKITLHWTQNESRNRGMYRIVDGLPQAVDPENNPLLPEYDPPTKEIQDRFLKLKRKGYTLEGKVRSPWYDKECLRPGANPQRIAQEYDLDFGGSVSRVYGEEFQQKARGMCRPPNVRGKFVFNSETLRGKFSEDKTGDVLLWTNLGVDRIPVKRQYALGADISWGTGSAFTNNSVVQVIDLVEMRQVCEFATTTMRPAQFADLCIAMAKWFHRGFLAWEIGGPGGEFTKRVLERGYENIYYRTVDETSTVGRHKKTKRVGWSPQKEEVRSGMFEGLLMGVLSDELQIHSHSLVEETGQYVYEGGKIIHSASQRSDDGADKGKSHGDRVVAMGVAYVAALDPLSNRPTDVKGEVQEDERPDTWAARDRYHEQLRRSKDDDWDARDNWELAGGRW